METEDRVQEVKLFLVTNSVLQREGRVSWELCK